MERINEICNADYADGCIAMTRDARSLNFDTVPNFLPDFSSMIQVVKGSMKIDIDGDRVDVPEGHLLFSISGKSLHNIEFSYDFEGRALFISTRFGQQIANIVGNLWSYLHQLDFKPVIKLPQETIDLLEQYYQLMVSEVRRRNNLYYDEIIQSLIRDMLYTLINDVRRSSIFDEEKLEAYSRSYRGSVQSLALFHRFMNLLTTEQCTHRNIDYYSSRLGVSPKYLSSVCKTISQRTARQWICITMANAIEGYLRYSDKSIKEISVMFGFPDMSVFSKFVKKQLGLTPNSLRK